MLSAAVDAALEATVVGSFSRVGYQVRRRLGRWVPAEALPRLDGRTVLVTGATSGIGRATAARLAQLGATVWFLARDEARALDAQAEIDRAGGGRADVRYALADLSDFESLRGFAARFSEAGGPLHTLVHNAGALTRDFRRGPDGSELTLAVHVLGPFLLTALLLPRLRAGAPARVITVSSGGMYTQRLDPDRLEAGREGYHGPTAYARAKRAQVVLGREWARRVPAGDVVFHTMHPGWVDTPGVESALPRFHRRMAPLLRTPDQGADTVVWLAADGEALRSTGGFWHDRRRRGEHRLPWTRRGEDGDRLWELCARRTGLGPAGPGLPHL